MRPSPLTQGKVESWAGTVDRPVLQQVIAGNLTAEEAREHLQGFKERWDFQKRRELEPADLWGPV